MLISPPNYAALAGPLVFLAGPIQGAPDWQQQAIGWLAEAAPELQIASPRWGRSSGSFEYAAQVDWETHHLRYAAQHGVIFFWLAREVTPIPGRAYAQTSRFELAEWKVRHERDGVKLVVGIEEGFSSARYIRQRFARDCPGVALVTTLEATCAATLELIRPEGAATYQPRAARL